jgi:hypothetical protein
MLLKAPVEVNLEGGGGSGCEGRIGEMKARLEKEDSVIDPSRDF